MSADDKQLLHLKLDEKTIKRVDDFRFKHRFPSRTEAIRWLLRYALEQKPKPGI
jgi:metal-responsive CopG/Arc/MetJ family transcriptional regulator